MPSGFLNADIQMPDLTDAGKDVETRLKETQDYLYLLLENLRYTLNNLEPGNFNEAGLKAITDPITASIADADGRISELALTAEGLASRVSDAEGNISTLEQTASGLSITVGTLAAQTTVYVNSQGMIIQNGTGQQVKIGNGAVKADFFYGQKYYDSTGYAYMQIDPVTSAYSSLSVYTGAINDGNTPFFSVKTDLTSTYHNLLVFTGSKYESGSWSPATIGTYNPQSDVFEFSCDVYGVTAKFG